MTEQARVPLTESVFLHVTLDIPTTSTSDFVADMGKMLPLFTAPCPPDLNSEITGFGWILLHAMKGPDVNGVTRFLHLWKLTDPARPSLTQVMEECGTHPEYSALDLLVDQEIQDLVHSNDDYTPRNWPPLDDNDTPLVLPPGEIYVHEVLDMARDAIKVNAFEDAMELIAVQAREQFGWTLLVALHSQTGKLRRYTHVWQIESADPARVQAASQWLANQSVYQQAVEQRAVDVMNGVDYVAAAPAAQA
jgi:hypothetical protein